MVFTQKSKGSCSRRVHLFARSLVFWWLARAGARQVQGNSWATEILHLVSSFLHLEIQRYFSPVKGVAASSAIDKLQRIVQPRLEERATGQREFLRLNIGFRPSSAGTLFLNSVELMIFLTRPQRCYFLRILTQKRCPFWLFVFRFISFNPFVSLDIAEKRSIHFTVSDTKLILYFFLKRSENACAFSKRK